MEFCDAFTLERSTGKLFWRNPSPFHAEKAGKEAGFINRGKGKNKDYWQISFAGKIFKRSRVVYYMEHGHWPTPCVDHVDGDSLNDRPENLREATLSQNAQNQRPRRFKASGLPQGVSPYRDKFRAQINVNGKRRVIGQFTDPSEASAAYIAAKKEVFGDYA